MSRRSNWMSCVALLAATAAVSLALGRAFADDAVLLASTVPGYVPGMVVSSTDRLSVPEGASATLLFQSGEMMRLGGPFEGTLGRTAGEGGQQQRGHARRSVPAARGGRNDDWWHSLNKHRPIRDVHRRRPGRCGSLRYLLCAAGDIRLDCAATGRSAGLRGSPQRQQQGVGLAVGGGARGVARGRPDRRRQSVRNRHGRHGARHRDLPRTAVHGGPRSGDGCHRDFAWMPRSIRRRTTPGQSVRRSA